MQTSHRLPHVRRVGSYALERLLATGGSAEIYLARQLTPTGVPEGPQVALKLPLRASPEQLDSLRREASALRSIEHPNVVRLLADGSSDSPPYLAMEYVLGVDLHQLRQRSSATQGAVPFDLACYVCREVALALQCVHEPTPQDAPVQMAHGDVAPSNILLSVQGDVRLGDFGLSTPAGEPAPGAVVASQWPLVPRGHKGYLSPERLCGHAAAPASDVFALGAILSEMLLGRSAFAGDGNLARLLSTRDGNIEPLLAQRSRIPTALIDLCRAALDPEPLRRPTAETLAAELTVFINRKSVRIDALRRSLSAWVSWASNQPQQSAELERQVRASVEVQRVVASTSGIVAMPDECNARLLRRDSTEPEPITFPELLSLVTSGALLPDDEVALWGSAFQAVASIPALARHLLPSTSARTSPYSPLGAADFVEQLETTPLFEVLANMATRRATGMLFVQQPTRDGLERKDLYLAAGRLTHVASSDRDQRLGHALVHSGIVTEAQLSKARLHMAHSQGQLGESLISLKLVDPVAVFTTLRNQGRSCVVSLCGWTSGTVTFFSQVESEQILFPLDLDLHVCLLAATSQLSVTLPRSTTRLTPGPECPPPGKNQSTVPLLNVVPSIARKRVTLATAMEELSLLSGRGVTTPPSSYLHVARALRWVEFG